MRALVWFWVGCLTVVGCGGGSAKSGSGQVVVFAAASLTGSFTEEGAAFEAKHPGVKVTFNFGASSTLVQQITQGAPVDVFASADTANMKKLTDASLVSGASTTFATNKLQIIVGKGNPKRITGLKDLANRDVIVVIGGPDVPIGKYAQQVVDKAGVKLAPKSLEADAKAVVNKVTIGEADAGIVYATDVLAAAAKADGVPIPDDVNVIATYPMAVLKSSEADSNARAFVAFVASTDGQAILAKYGFAKP
jgi:molybdate transport system substrate-binding protein